MFCCLSEAPGRADVSYVQTACGWTVTDRHVTPISNPVDHTITLVVQLLGLKRNQLDINIQYVLSFQLGDGSGLLSEAAVGM